MNLLLLSRADAIVGKARSSYALLAAGMSGGATAGRPFYEVGKGRTCTRVTCDMLPGIQQVRLITCTGFTREMLLETWESIR